MISLIRFVAVNNDLWIERANCLEFGCLDRYGMAYRRNHYTPKHIGYTETKSREIRAAIGSALVDKIAADNNIPDKLRLDTNYQPLAVRYTYRGISGKCDEALCAVKYRNSRGKSVYKQYNVKCSEIGVLESYSESDD